MADEVGARLRLIRTAGIGPVTYAQLIARFGTAQAALDALPTLARRGGGAAPAPPPLAQVEREIAEVRRLGARHLFLGDPDYPRLLAHIDTAPPALIVVWKHGANIERLLAGTEPRIGRRARG